MLLILAPHFIHNKLLIPLPSPKNMWQVSATIERVLSEEKNHVFQLPASNPPVNVRPQGEKVGKGWALDRPSSPEGWEFRQ